MPFKDLTEGETHSFPPPHAKNMTGERYGRLVVTCDWFSPKRKNGSLRWLCICDCGNKVIVTRDNLIHKNVTSCGCFSREVHSNLKKECIGEKNHNWTGDNVSYEGLHLWIKRHKPKSDKCEHCGKNGKLDAANLSGKYKRDIKDFRWLCRKCHMKIDGRIKRKNKYGRFIKNKCYFGDKCGEPEHNQCDCGLSPETTREIGHYLKCARRKEKTWWQEK